MWFKTFFFYHDWCHLILEIPSIIQINMSYIICDLLIWNLGDIIRLIKICHIKNPTPFSKK